MSRFLYPTFNGTTSVDAASPLINVGTPTQAVLKMDTALFGGYDTTVQTAASVEQSYTVALNTVYISNHITLADNEITFARSGVYKHTFSVQLSNPTTTIAKATFFMVVNGSAAPYSASTATVPVKHGQIPGHIIMEVSFIGAMTNGDTLGLGWHSSVAGVKIETIPGTTLYPESPSVILLSNEISSVLPV